MFTLFKKKKVTENVTANIFINSIFNTIDSGFPEIVGILNDAPEFVSCPQLSIANDDHFVLIVFATNIDFIENYFESQNADSLKIEIIEKLSEIFGTSSDELTKAINSYQKYLSKINFPSKNKVYAMSKAIFGKYNLYDFQDDYFKNMKSPNPMLLKRLDEVMESFVFNWEVFDKKYHLSH